MLQDQDNDTESSESEGGSRPAKRFGEIVTSGVVIIKKSYISLIRPMDSLETVSLNAGLDVEQMHSNIHLFGKVHCQIGMN